MKSGIYCILNKKNKKRYVGSSNCLSKRFNNHKVKLRNNKHFNIHLQKAFNKYRENQFQFLVLEYCRINNLINREQYYMNLYNVYKNGYNIAPTADRTIVSEETKRKISKANKGNRGSLGYKHTIKAKNKISKFHKGNKYCLNRHSKDQAIAISGKGNGRYIDGRCLKNYYCIDCKKKISTASALYGKERCASCANSGKNNPSYKKKLNGGKTNEKRQTSHMLWLLSFSSNGQISKQTFW